MDATDRKIIAELRTNGRLSNVELAERVGLTPAPAYGASSASRTTA
jgi:DNA-binding Lrp family transcriptional regulator